MKEKTKICHLQVLYPQIEHAMFLYRGIKNKYKQIMYASITTIESKILITLTMME